jgi:hypothetical protein
LAGIENVLASLASKLSDLDIRRDPTESSSQSRSSRKGTGRSPGALDEASTPAPFEGETTINSQSGYVQQLLAKAVSNTPSIEQNAEVKSALTALNNLVTRQGQITAPSASNMHTLINRSLADVDPAKLDKPPWDMISDVIERACSKYLCQSSYRVSYDSDSGRDSRYKSRDDIPLFKDEKPYVNHRRCIQ